MVREKLAQLYAEERRRIAGIPDDRGDYHNPVFGEGPDAPAVLLVGEAPGGEEAARGRPFVGKAGKQLNELLGAAGIDRSSVYVTNAVKFRPVNRKARSISNRTPSGAELKAGLPLLKSELELLRPAVIVTLGNTPLKAVSAIAGLDRLTVGEAHGKRIEVRLNGYECTLIPQYHPASVIYNRSLLEVLGEDIRELGIFIKETEGTE